MDGDANFETRFAELKSQMDMLTTEGKGKVDTSSGTNQSCSMVVGGLLSLNSLKEATTWMADILQKLNGPTGQEMYMKTKEFQGILFVKFGSSYERDVATAVVRSAQLTMGETHVWATPDLPIPVRARKVFLLGLRWQLGEWGFSKTWNCCEWWLQIFTCWWQSRFAGDGWKRIPFHQMVKWMVATGGIAFQHRDENLVR